MFLFSSFETLNYERAVTGSFKRWVSVVRCDVEEIIGKIRARDGLCSFTPNIEYSVGDGSREKNQNWLDILDKTEPILKSCHSVRYLIQRRVLAKGPKGGPFGSYKSHTLNVPLENLQNSF